VALRKRTYFFWGEKIYNIPKRQEKKIYFLKHSKNEFDKILYVSTGNPSARKRSGLLEGEETLCGL